MPCPQCHRPTPSDAKFCPECGGRLSVACSACGVDNTPGSKFCKECGQTLTRAAASPAPPRSPAPQTYTPSHLAQRILHARPSLEGERKQVTVLFADVKGSMELLADRDPEEARGLLDPVIKRMIEAVHHYEGTVNQVMGDGIMALFGAPLAHEDHAVRACYAALRMQEEIQRYTVELRHSRGLEVQIRVGMNSGEVVVGSIDDDLRINYTAIGQTTHLAARMEQLATPGTIRLTAETLRLAEGLIHVRPLGPIPVKGLGDPVEAHELIGAAAARTRLQAASARGLSRFVGRDDEMVQLQTAAEQAGRGRGQMVAVVGEPGVGKSRLFHEFIESDRVRNWLVLRSASVAYGKATAYLPLIDLLKDYFKIADSDDARSIRSKVTGAMLTLDAALTDFVPPLLWLLEAFDGDDTFADLDPSQRRRRTLEAIRRLLLRESRVQPLLVVFEDLHWIDDETQAFLDSLVEGLPTVAILLAVNYRPEYQHGWIRKTYYRQLRIDPLPPDTAEALLTTLLGADSSIAPLRRLLIARTEGNPLFLEESVWALAETRTLVGERGAYRLAKPTETIQVPPTVQAILAARIDRLPAEHKRLLQAASVVGKDVPFALLRAIAGLDDDALRGGLAQLQAAEFLYETSLFPDVEYTFKHALTHDVAYSSLLAERRRQLHTAIVDAMERMHPDRLAEQVDVVAHHATHGESREKAAHYLHQAGAKAVARSAVREAVSFFEQALAILGELPETPETLSESLDIRIALGPALIGLKSAADPEVVASYDHAEELVDRLSDEDRRFPVLWGRWFSAYTQGDYPAAQGIGERLLEAARSSEDSGRLVEAHHSLWATFTAMGAPTAAIPHAERGVALYVRERHSSQMFTYGGHDPGACCRYQLAFDLWLIGWPDRARDSLRDAQRLATQLQHPLTETVTLWFASWVYYQRGDRSSAIEAAERLQSIAREHGFSPWTDGPIVLLPAARGARVDRESLPHLHAGIVAGRSAAWRYLLCLCVLAELCLLAELPDEGLARLASIPENNRETVFAPEVRRLEGELLLRRSASAADVAERKFRDALGLARKRGEKSLELRAAMSLARLLASRGSAPEGRAVLAPAYEWFTQGFDTADLIAAKSLLAELG
jgi:class 3 adenylate cyclase/tetratricopeptide (TPR) repeat protein